METTDILFKIKDLQSPGNQYYAPGLFPSQRFHLHLPCEREDNNIFFTASIVFILQKLRDKFSEQEKAIADDICSKAIANYPGYRNKDGLDTYNFWRTDGSPHFPNGRVLSRIKKVRIPDDADDTSLIYLTSDPSPEKVLWLKEKLAQHANLSTKQISNTFPEYKAMKAYSTFFGKNMFIEFDVCVLCNILYFVFQNKLPLNQNDHDSISFIRSVIEKKQYLHKPFYASHSYPSAPVILYHVARLMEKFDVPGLSDIISQVIQDLWMLFEKEENGMDKVILLTALTRLKEKCIKPFVPIAMGNAQGDSRWSFFHAGLLTAFETPVTYKLAGNSFFHIKYKCEAHRLALLLESHMYSYVG